MKQTLVSRSYRLPSRAAGFLLIALLAGGSVSTVVRADAVSDAKARVDAAQDNIEKINALYFYAQALNGVKASPQQVRQARTALDEALAIVAAQEKAGKILKPQSQIHFLAGNVARRQGDTEAALRYFDAAERTGYAGENSASPERLAFFFSRRGEVKWWLYDYAGALADFDRAIEKGGGKSDYALRARLHFDMGNEEAARADWSKGDQFAVEELGVVEAARRVRGLMDNGASASEKFPFDPSLLPLNRALVQSPRTAQPLVNRATYLIRKGFSKDGGKEEEIVKAERDIKQVLRLEPRSSAALHLQALALWRRATLKYKLADSETNEAIRQAFESALQSSDDVTRIRLDVGDYYMARARALLFVLLQDKKATPKARQDALIDAMYNYSALLLEKPNNTLAHARRITLEQMSERPDSHTLLIASQVIAREGLIASPDTIDESEAETLRLAAQTAGAQALLQNGELTQAQQVLDATLKNVNNAANLRLRGQIHVLRGRYDAAIADLETSLNFERGNAQSWWWLGLAQDGKGNIPRANAMLQNAIRLDARLAPQLVGTRYATTNPTTRALVMPPVTGELKPQGTALQHKENGNALVAKGDKGGALSEYNVALLINPNFADALNNRAGIYREQGKVDLAINDLNRALQIDPQHRVAWLVRSRVYASMGKTKQALADANNAVRFADNNDNRYAALISRVRLHMLLKDKISATKDLDEAEKLPVKDTEKVQQIAELRVLLGA